MATAQGSILLGLPWVCQSIRTEMFGHHLIHREQQCNHMPHTQVRMQLQTAFLVMFKEKKKTKTKNRNTSLCHWDKPPTWKASNFGSTPQHGGYRGPKAITGKLHHVLAEKKFISSCNELKLLSSILNTQPVGTRNDLLHPTSWSLTSEHEYFCSIKGPSQLQQQEDNLNWLSASIKEWTK